MFKYFFSILVLFVSFELCAQAPIYKRYTVKDGLPSNEVYQAMQDSKGYIWFATDNGVSRFNGYEFENFSTKDGLAGSTIFYMYEDFRQRIWFVSFSKQLSYFENDSIYPYQYNHLISDTLIDRNIILTGSFYVDSLETIHFGTHRQGLFKIDKEGFLSNILDRKFAQIEFVNDKVLLAASGTIDTLDEKSFAVNYYKKYALKLYDKSGSYVINDLLLSGLYARRYGLRLNSKQLLFSNYYDLYIIEDSTVIKKYSNKNGIPWIGKDKYSNLWVSRLKKGVDRYKNLNLDSKPSQYLLGKTVLSAYTDNDLSVWLTTKDGVYYYPSLELKHIGSKESPNRKVNCVETGKLGELWWTNSGSDVFCLKDDHVFLYSGEMAYSHIRDLDYNLSTKKLFLTGDHVLSYIENGNRKKIALLKHGAPFKGEVERFNFKQVVQVNDSLMWAVPMFGQIDVKNKIWNQIGYGKEIYNKEINCVFSDSSRVFLGTMAGLWQYEDNEFHFLGEDHDLLKHRIDDIAQDKQGNLWLVTKANGVLVHHEDTTIQMLEEDGLSSNTVTSIFVDEDVVWVGTMNGLNKIIIEDVFKGKYQIERIYEYHGLASNVINDIAADKKTVYLGTDNGLSYFDKSEFALNTNEVPVYFTNISIQEQDTIVQGRYDLSYSQNTLSIEFVGLSYRNSKLTRYRYRLLGVENGWIETSNRQVRYPALNPGEYQFELLAMNENGLWNTEAKVIQFVIHKPFWQTWWFYVLSLLLFSLIIGSVIYLFFRMRLNENRKRTVLHQNLARLRQEALAQQMNPHFIFNTLSSIQYYINENDKNASNKYLTMFARLMRMTLDNSYQKNISIQEELEALEIYIKLEQLRFDDKFTYAINVEHGFKPDHYMMPALLFQPFVENAIWHGIMHKQDKSGHINIHLSKFGDTVQCVIIDNGIGRKKSSEINKNRNKTHKSLGAKITESRLQLISTSYSDQLHVEYIDLEDEKGLPLGTKAVISLPLMLRTIQT